MEKKEITYWPMTVCLSSKCNRNCSHCSFDANMERGCYFSVENAKALALDMRRGVKVGRERDIIPQLDFTGNGELLLNPNLVEIFDIFFGQNQKTVGNLVISGVNSKAPEEAKRLSTILSRDYASRLCFNLSYNLFEKRFSKRLITTLKLLFENGVKNVGIKICQTRQRTLLTRQRLLSLLFHYFIRWIREIDPLASWEAIYDCHLGYEAEVMNNELAFLTGGHPLAEMRELSEKEIIADMVWFRSNHRSAFRFVTKFGLLEIRIEPHFLTKRGRAVNIRDLGFPRNKHKWLCRFLVGHDTSYLHVGADGFYYPSCGCPNAKSLRIGHVHENSKVVYHRFIYLQKALLRAIISEQRIYADVCQFCRQVSAELHYDKLNKPLSQYQF